jgi:hypothetical protein
MIDRSYLIKAVLFDFDGTLSKPGTLDFPRLKKEIGCPPNHPVLEFIDGLPTRFERETSLSVLEQFEMAGAVRSEPNPGAEDLIASAAVVSASSQSMSSHLPARLIRGLASRSSA